MGTVNRRRLRGCGIALAVWLSATGALGTCNFFKPAVPEAPNLAPIIPDYSYPTQTLETLAKGVVDKNRSNGRAVYLQAFAESISASGQVIDGRAYHAFFDLRDVVEHGGWTGDWNRDLEPVVYDRLVRITNPLELTWELYPPPGNEMGSDVDSLLHRKYKLVQVSGTGASATRTPVAIGAADLYFVKSASANHWVIARWQDYHTIDADSTFLVTLGKLRLETQP